MNISLKNSFSANFRIAQTYVHSWLRTLATMFSAPKWAQRGTWKLTKYLELYSKYEKVQKEQTIIVLI